MAWTASRAGGSAPRRGACHPARTGEDGERGS